MILEHLAEIIGFTITLAAFAGYFYFKTRKEVIFFLMETGKIPNDLSVFTRLRTRLKKIRRVGKGPDSLDFVFSITYDDIDYLASTTLSGEVAIERENKKKGIGT